MVGPLVLMFGIGISSSPVLAWTAGILLVLMTVNVLVSHLR
jgi:hypothetical protein